MPCAQAPPHGYSRGHRNCRPVTTRREGDPFYVVQHTPAVDREAIVWNSARPQATAAILCQCSGQDLSRNSHAEDATRLHGACNPSCRDEVEDGRGGDVVMSVAPVPIKRTLPVTLVSLCVRLPLGVFEPVTRHTRQPVLWEGCLLACLSRPRCEVRSVDLRGRSEISRELCAGTEHSPSEECSSAKGATSARRPDAALPDAQPRASCLTAAASPFQFAAAVHPRLQASLGSSLSIVPNAHSSLHANIPSR